MFIYQVLNVNKWTCVSVSLLTFCLSLQVKDKQTELLQLYEEKERNQEELKNLKEHLENKNTEVHVFIFIFICSLRRLIMSAVWDSKYTVIRLLELFLLSK